MAVSEQQAQEDFRYDPSANRPKLRSRDRDLFLYGNLHFGLMLHGFCEDVGPQRTIVLKHGSNRIDANDRRVRGVLLVHSLANEDILVVHRLNAHGPGYVLARRQTEAPTPLKIAH